METSKQGFWGGGHSLREAAFVNNKKCRLKPQSAVGLVNQYTNTSSCSVLLLFYAVWLTKNSESLYSIFGILDTTWY